MRELWAIPYLGSQINQTTTVNDEMKSRIVSGHRWYYSRKVRIVDKQLKLKIHKSLVRPEMTYGYKASSKVI